MYFADFGANFCDFFDDFVLLPQMGIETTHMNCAFYR